ncbi:MAG: YceI family protein [Desulfatiglandales bacterium]
MKSLFRLVAAFALLTACLGDAHGAPSEWRIDRVHSSIYFDVKHTFATVRGQFDDFSVSLIIDEENKAASRCDIEVDVKSVNTNNRQRDNHLRSADFFSVKEYPVMAFTTTGIRDLEKDRFEIEGRLTIKDVTKEVIVPFTFLGVKENPLDPKQVVAGFEARFSVDRLEYNVGTGKFYKMGVIGKDVDIIITLEAFKQK